MARGLPARAQPVEPIWFEWAARVGAFVFSAWNATSKIGHEKNFTVFDRAQDQNALVGLNLAYAG